MIKGQFLGPYSVINVMEFCTSRHFLLSIFIIQIVTVSTRQVFDFLGFMWASVLANFTYTLFIIFGIFGVIQCRSNYTISYTVCSSVWILWNAFVMCFYMNSFGLNKNIDIFSLGTGSTSWWEANGPGCKAIFLTNHSAVEEDPFEPIRPDYVTGCILEYQLVEIIQAAVQAVLAIWGCITGVKVANIFIARDDSSETNSSKKQNGVLPLYSIEYSPRNDDNDDDTSHSANEDHHTVGGARRPMTPRRVKRRSINSRGTLPHSQHNQYANQHQTQHDQQPPPYVRRQSYSSTRSSTRSLPRKIRPVSTHNPVDRYLEQQQSTFHHQVLHDSSTSNDSFRLPYSSQSQLLSPSDLLEHPNTNTATNNMGHSNPSFVSNTSLDRPPSARSSYSNYHGVRTLSSYTNNQATPQVPTNTYRKSLRSSTHSTFFNNGPPAYDIHGCVNSETVI